MKKGTAFFADEDIKNKPSYHIVELKEEYDYLAPDTSEIRLLLTEKEAKKGSMAHCILPPEKTSIAVKHKTIEELWYFISGNGELWLKDNSEDNGKVYEVKRGVSISIPPGVSFQFRNLSQNEPLEIIITGMPPWPGPEEALQVEGKWKASAHEQNLTLKI
jgi:mannose-6-phosphate isomerase-like protein (cupin superfamily)